MAKKPEDKRSRQKLLEEIYELMRQLWPQHAPLDLDKVYVIDRHLSEALVRTLMYLGEEGFEQLQGSKLQEQMPASVLAEWVHGPAYTTQQTPADYGVDWTEEYPCKLISVVAIRQALDVLKDELRQCKATDQVLVTEDGYEVVKLAPTAIATLRALHKKLQQEARDQEKDAARERAADLERARKFRIRQLTETLGSAQVLELLEAATREAGKR